MKIIKSCVVAAFSLWASANVSAEVLSDFRIQSDRSTEVPVDPGNSHAIDDQVFTNTQAYVKDLVDAGYPTPSIILHMVTRGMSVSDVAYFTTLADVSLAEEIYVATADLLPYLPSWVCDERLSVGYIKPAEIAAADGGLQKLGYIRDIADAYFSNDERTSPAGYDRWSQPDWTKGERHLDASVDALIELARENTQNGQQGWWYRNDSNQNVPARNGTPVLVGLYSRSKEIVVDASLDDLLALKQQGTVSVPAVIIYNPAEYYPAYELSKVEGSASQDTKPGHDVLSVRETLDRFFNSGERLSPVREWHSGDYHFKASLAEMGEVFDLPKSGTLDEATGQGAGPGSNLHPVLITVFDDSRSYWVDNPTRVAMAIARGDETIPVVFLYHEMQRYACDIPGTCLPAVAAATQQAAQELVGVIPALPPYAPPSSTFPPVVRPPRPIGGPEAGPAPPGDDEGDDEDDDEIVIPPDPPPPFSPE